MLEFKRDCRKAKKELEHYADEHFTSDIVYSILDAFGGNRYDVESLLENWR